MSIVIVTGAFGALGSQVVTELARVGHSVVAIDKAKAPSDGHWAQAFGDVDLGDRHGVAETFDTVASDLGPIDALVNVAGGFVWETVADGSIESWDRMYAINLKTAVTATQAALRHFGDGGGAIVNVGAAAAAHPGVGMAPYAASKAGIGAFTESLAAELATRNIRVNAVLPTIIDTPANRADMPDADRSGWVRPEAAAKVIAFLISSDAGAISGATIPLTRAG